MRHFFFFEVYNCYGHVMCWGTVLRLWRGEGGRSRGSLFRAPRAVHQHPTTLFRDWRPGGLPPVELLLSILHTLSLRGGMARKILLL